MVESDFTYIRLGICRHCNNELILEWDNVSDHKGYCYACGYVYTREDFR